MYSVKLYYGPYQSYGVLRHRPMRIRGLINALALRGFVVEAFKIETVNRLEIELEDRLIYQCDVRNLSFNMHHDDDIVCQRAVKVVVEAASALQSQYINNLQQNIDSQ